MRILTEEQAIARLTSDKNVARVLYTDRKDAVIEGQSRAPLGIEFKAMVAAHVDSGMRVKDVGALFGIKATRAGRIANGQKLNRAGAHVPDVELNKVMKTVHETVAEKATNLVMSALEQVTEGRLNSSQNKLRDITGAAKDLASIVEKVSPKTESGNIAAVVLMGTAPFQADRYKVLETSAVVVK